MATQDHGPQHYQSIGDTGRNGERIGGVTQRGILEDNVKPGHMPSSIQRRLEYIEQRLTAVENASPALVLDQNRKAWDESNTLAQRLLHAEKFIGEQATLIGGLRDRIGALLSGADRETQLLGAARKMEATIAELREQLEVQRNRATAFYLGRTAEQWYASFMDRKADAELGALVRQMPDHCNLFKDGSFAASTCIVTDEYAEWARKTIDLLKDGD